MKTIQFLVLVLFLSSCSKDAIEPNPQFNFFENKQLSFEYYDPTVIADYLIISDLKIKVEQVRLNGRDYQGFYDHENFPTPIFALSATENLLGFNLLPIRYENGNYFEYRGTHNFWGIESTNEVLILKDDLKKGDEWMSAQVLDNGELLTHEFEVIEQHDVFVKFGIEHLDVFQIKETMTSNNPLVDKSISMHFYNREKGIIRRELPHQVSGTFSSLILSRME